MPRKPRVHAPGLLYHVIARGNQKKKIFFDELDYRAYIKRIHEAKDELPFRLYAYCLMPNHIHLLIEVGHNELSDIMHKIQLRYAQYHNAKYKKTGHVFEGPYIPIIVDSNTYLLELVRYIPLNPVRAGMVEKPELYPWSSYHQYFSKKCDKWLDRDPILAQFAKNRKQATKLFRAFVYERISEGHQDKYYDLTDNQFLGDEDFANTVLLGEVEEIHKPEIKASIDDILKVVCNEMKILAADICQHRRDKNYILAREMISLIAVENNISLTEVAIKLGRDSTSICKYAKNLRIRIRIDNKIRRIKEIIEKICANS